MKNYLVLFFVIFMVLFTALPGYAEPWVLRSGDEVVTKDQIIEGDIIFGGNRLEVNGVVKGDLVVFAKDVEINGQIEGSLLGIVFNQLIINGYIGRDFRVLANVIAFDGTVQRSATIGAAGFYAGPKSHIDGGLFGRFTVLRLNGSIKGPVDISGAYITQISGEIDGNMKVHGIGPQWVPPFKTSGKVTDYTGADPPVKQKGIEFTGGYETEEENYAVQLALLQKLYLLSFIWFLGTVLLSLIFYRLFPQTAWKITEPTPANFRRSLIIGLVCFIVIPIVIIILIVIMMTFPLTMVALPLTVLLLFIYIFLLMFSGIPVYLWFGRLVFKSKLRPNFMIILGGILVLLISLMPIFNLLFIWIGFGLLLGSARPQYK